MKSEIRKAAHAPRGPASRAALALGYLCAAAALAGGAQASPGDVPLAEVQRASVLVPEAATTLSPRVAATRLDPPRIAALPGVLAHADDARLCAASASEYALPAALASLALRTFDRFGAEVYECVPEATAKRVAQQPECQPEEARSAHEARVAAFDGKQPPEATLDCAKLGDDVCVLQIAPAARAYAEGLDRHAELDHVERLLHLIALSPGARAALSMGYHAAKALCAHSPCAKAEPPAIQLTLDGCQHEVAQLRLPATPESMAAVKEFTTLYAQTLESTKGHNPLIRSWLVDAGQASGSHAFSYAQEAAELAVEVVTQSYLNPDCTGEERSDACYHVLYDASSFCHVTSGEFGVIQRVGECCVRAYSCDGSDYGGVLDGTLADYDGLGWFTHCDYYASAAEIEALCH